MQKYIYGNIGHRQYTYLSTAPDFFSDSRRVEELRHLVTYDIYGKHQGLQPGEHQCYWGLTTDLNIPGEPERLYLQCSGGDTYRSAFYAQGFMSDSKDGFLYGKGFLQLLRLHFPTGEETLKRADSGPLTEAFPQLDLDPSLSPAELDPELLRSILLLLLQGRKVLLRIDASGKEAMHRSREILLAIYSRLPYGQRRLNGFLTGCTPAQLQNEENTLPGAISLILADADTPASELYLDGAQLLDMNEPVKPVPRSFQGKPLPHTALLDYLMQSDMETLDSFFKTASQNIEQDRSPTVADYSLMLELFKQVSRPITDAVLAEWAIQLQSGSLQGDLRQMLMEGDGPYRLSINGLSLHHSGCGPPPPPEHQAEGDGPCICGLSDLRRQARQDESEHQKECLALQLLRRRRRDAGAVRQSVRHQQLRRLPGDLRHPADR